MKWGVGAASGAMGVLFDLTLVLMKVVMAQSVSVGVFGLSMFQIPEQLYPAGP